MSLAKLLPVELWLQIANELASNYDIRSLAVTCKYLHENLVHLLYSRIICDNADKGYKLLTEWMPLKAHHVKSLELSFHVDVAFKKELFAGWVPFQCPKLEVLVVDLWFIVAQSDDDLSVSCSIVDLFAEAMPKLKVITIVEHHDYGVEDKDWSEYPRNLVDRFFFTEAVADHKTKFSPTPASQHIEELDMMNNMFDIDRVVERLAGVGVDVQTPLALRHVYFDNCRLLDEGHVAILMGVELTRQGREGNSYLLRNLETISVRDCDGIDYEDEQVEQMNVSRREKYGCRDVDVLFWNFDPYQELHFPGVFERRDDEDLDGFEDYDDNFGYFEDDVESGEFPYAE